MSLFAFINDRVKKQGIVLTTLVILASRIPFLFAGYGSEEDACGMALTARNIAQTGIYEYSRLPGHPVQELIYAVAYQTGSFGFNLLTAIISTTGILFFMLALKQAAVKNYNMAGMSLAFTPVVFVASTNAMDYTWAMTFILISFYLLLLKKPVWAGLALGLAVGCRITSGAVLLPFLIICSNDDPERRFGKPALQFILSTILVSLILFIPAFLRYGLAFFDFYKTVYPSVAKAFYKYSIAAYGSLGLLALLVLKAQVIFRYKKNNTPWQTDGLKGKLNILCLSMLFIYSALYWYLPQKAAFMIPAIPFVLLFLILNVSENNFTGLTSCLVISCFFFGINLYDAYRGSEPSALAIPFGVAGQQVVFDPLAGVVTDDYGKRKQRLAYSRKIISITDTLNVKAAIIAGWWLGDILVQQHESKTRAAVFYYYADEPTLQHLRQKGYAAYFLNEQDLYNDERYGYKFTGKYAVQWPY